MDAKYVKGMINNPDLQPNATINRWIAGILLFTFKLVHISADKHKGPDGLSHRPPSAADPPDEDNVEDWLDDAYSFAIVLLNERSHPELYSRRDGQRYYSHNSLPVYFSRYHSNPSYRISLDDTDVTQAYSLLLDSADPPTQPSEEQELPRSPKAKARENRIRQIRQFLETQERPEGMSDKDYKSFLNSATRFFVLKGSLWRREPHGKHQLVVPEGRRYGLIKEAHDDLGHKGVFTVRTRLLLRFWWPMLVEDVKWYLRTCYPCQIRQTEKLRIPPQVALVGGLFRKVHIDTMLMPKASGYRYIVQARCALTGYPEWRMLRAENASALASFIFEDILCRWGAVAEIVTDNGPSFVQALEHLAMKHSITHIRISPYNSQANGIVERRHYDVQEAIMKSCDGEEAHWPRTVHSVFWAERVTIQRATGLSPYFMAHGVELLFPFDLSEATFLIPAPEADPLSTFTLLGWCACQLQKHEEDLESIRDREQHGYGSGSQFRDP
jgi:integrase-like protein